MKPRVTTTNTVPTRRTRNLDSGVNPPSKPPNKPMQGESVPVEKRHTSRHGRILARREGRLIQADGYVIVHQPNSPYIEPNSRGYVSEHRLVMAHHLGRPLHPTEAVHHRNGIRHDNRIANLELWVKGHPAGQRVHDLIRFVVVVGLYPDQVAEAMRDLNAPD